MEYTLDQLIANTPLSIELRAYSPGVQVVAEFSSRAQMTLRFDAAETRLKISVRGESEINDHEPAIAERAHQATVGPNRVGQLSIDLDAVWRYVNETQAWHLHNPDDDLFVTEFNVPVFVYTQNSSIPATKRLKVRLAIGVQHHKQGVEIADVVHEDVVTTPLTGMFAQRTRIARFRLACPAERTILRLSRRAHSRYRRAEHVAACFNHAQSAAVAAG